MIIALTSDRFYALRGIRPQTKLSRAIRRLHPSYHFRIGRNVWYVIRGRGPSGVLKVRHGVVQEVGIADRRLTGSRRTADRFLTSFK